MEVIVEIKYKGRTLLEGAFGYYYKRDVYIPLKELLKKFECVYTVGSWGIKGICFGGRLHFKIDIEDREAYRDTELGSGTKKIMANDIILHNGEFLPKSKKKTIDTSKEREKKEVSSSLLKQDIYINQNLFAWIFGMNLHFLKRRLEVLIYPSKEWAISF